MKELEIRPLDVFDEYLKLCTNDVVDFFSELELDSIDCPACGAVGRDAFSKVGFNYQTCEECQTLYVSPRPPSAAFERYYTQSPSVKFWATTFYKVTELARREKLWRPKAELVCEKLSMLASADVEVIDIGGGYGVFCEELSSLTSVKTKVIEPSPDLAAVCRKKGLEVIQKFLFQVDRQELGDSAKFFVSFELFEHLHDPKVFLEQVYKLMDSGDAFLFTTLSGTGLDIQVLWEDSKAVSPPHHLNFFNPYSVRLLLSRLGFAEIQVTTPGQLDINILQNNSGMIKDRFWATVLKMCDDSMLLELQKSVADAGCSSHMMVFCSKP